MNLMINDRNHPKQLFSTNKEGIPWEEASKAAYSNGLLAGWVRRSRLLNILYVLLCVSVTLTVPVFVLSFTIAVGKLHVDLTVEFLLWLAFPIFLILDVVLGLFYCYISGYKDRKYYVALAEDGKGCWDPVDPSIGYTNLSVPIIVQGRLETFLCVCPEHLWDSACETRDSYFPLALDLDDRFRQFRKVPIPSEVMFLTPDVSRSFLPTGRTHKSDCLQRGWCTRPSRSGGLTGWRWRKHRRLCLVNRVGWCLGCWMITGRARTGTRNTETRTLRCCTGLLRRNLRTVKAWSSRNSLVKTLSAKNGYNSIGAGRCVT